VYRNLLFAAAHLTRTHRIQETQLVRPTPPAVVTYLIEAEKVRLTSLVVTRENNHVAVE
jgi:hypothetical protein